MLRSCRAPIAGHKGDRGLTLIETVVALSILGVISVTFLNGLSSASRSVYIGDQQSTAESLAQTQMEWVKNTDYSYNATSYDPAPIPTGKDYVNYSVNITAGRLHPDDDYGIQKITVTVAHHDRGIVRLEGFKVDR